MYSWYSTRIVHEQMVQEAMEREQGAGRPRHARREQRHGLWHRMLTYAAHKQDILTTCADCASENRALAINRRDAICESACDPHEYCCGV